MDLTLLQLLAAAAIGLTAGVVGGLAGVGGSMVMLPALHWVFGEKSDSTHHLYMAAAMTVNVAVAFPAALRHHRMGAVRRDLLLLLLPVTTLFIILGVLTGNLIAGDRLRIALAIFIFIYCGFNLARLASKTHVDAAGERATRTRLSVSGATTGFSGGILGIGGGVVLVPMLQMLCRVRLKQAIATSTAVMSVTAIIGAGLKLATLGALPGGGESWVDALKLAAAMAPTAILGGILGASLTHWLPTKAVRAVVTVLLIIAAAKLAGLWGG